MKLIKGDEIRKNEQLMKSFFQFSEETFQLQFEQWAQLGYWNDSYCCYAFEDKGEIVANVSTSIGTMILEGQAYQSVQIGTVMTKPGYQGQGLSRKLMEAALEDVQQAQFVYLFANASVLQFYTKFGFEKRRQATYHVKTADFKLQLTEVKKLDMNEPKARELLYETIMHRLPISMKMSMLQNEDIVMYHALTQYKDCIYYVPKLKAIIICQEEDGVLELIDVISKYPIGVVDVLQNLPITAPSIQLCFTPDELTIPVVQGIFEDDGAMFVKEQSKMHYPNNVLYPYSGLA
ncbi:histone acetyltransferase [Solibacillus sp. R5-41]|uniref:GNAT family N-acetyltransferase n=1 Tax=Solibacillus sp. R5-41 TaxID=2048654 RepID=UPI000C129948|nr:GNAT family N-acetyltransferase [Solibacillus sp. R5-41]ATP41961.1 histone acetyltransferase [Solibacillus sp. R5-41]